MIFYIATAMTFQTASLCVWPVSISAISLGVFFAGCFYFDREEEPCVEVDNTSARMNRQTKDSCSQECAAC